MDSQYLHCALILMQLNKANSFDTEVSLIDLNIFLSNGTLFTSVGKKRVDFDFIIVIFHSSIAMYLGKHVMDVRFVSLEHLLTV